jgi:hypothetical protein
MSSRSPIARVLARAGNAAAAGTRPAADSRPDVGVVEQLTSGLATERDRRSGHVGPGKRTPGPPSSSFGFGGAFWRLIAAAWFTRSRRPIPTE